MNRHRARLAVVLLVSFGLDPDSPPSRADDGPADEADRAARMIAAEAKRWLIRISDDPGHSSAANKVSNLRYTNPAVGRVHGDVYFFIADGRPAAVMAIYKWFSPWTGFEAELQSLASGPVWGLRDDKLVWHPEAPGITLRDVPEAPRPAASAAARGRQMRAIAGGFSTRLVDSRVAATGREQTLRLLPTPLYNYEPREAPIRDGALFAYVLGTDPELFLLLEVGQIPGGPRWQYGLARLNSDAMATTYQGREVWRAAKVVDRYDARATYFSKELPQEPATP